jgi:CRP-like cAMP-binding protein
MRPPPHLMPTNRLIAALPRIDRELLTSAFEPIVLTPRNLLFDVDRPIEFVYFVEHGVVSLVVPMPDGTAVETATVGNEGFVGLPAYLGSDRSTAQAFCQIAGAAKRVAVADFHRAVRLSDTLDTILKRYTLAYLTQVSQTSACNRLHTMRERCARWLLQCHDRVQSDTFHLTQDFLAQMLGVRRATVSEAASALQAAGLIHYEYGRMTIRDRLGLEQATCPCYAIVTREWTRLMGNYTGPSMFHDTRTSEDGQSTLRAPAAEQSADL